MDRSGKTTKTRDAILAAGAGIVHSKGFNNTGIQEVLAAAGVPKGSFYFYFENKNDFGLQLIDFYARIVCSKLEEAVDSPGSSSVQRLRAYFTGFYRSFETSMCTGGCPIGNLAQEMGDLNEEFRQRLESVFVRLQTLTRRLLVQAQEAGEIAPHTDTRELATFILNSWQGAIVEMKVAKSLAPLKTFEKIVFETLLR